MNDSSNDMQEFEESKGRSAHSLVLFWSRYLSATDKLPDAAINTIPNGLLLDF
jgi:hypothetical protein